IPTALLVLSCRVLSAASSSLSLTSLFLFFTDTATTEIYTLSLHDALPISLRHKLIPGAPACVNARSIQPSLSKSKATTTKTVGRSEEHTSELQSHLNLVCRLLLEKKKQHESLEDNRIIKFVSSVISKATVQ